MADDPTCRLTTREMFDADPPALRIIAVAWDSAFRLTELRVGDQIVVVNGTPVERPSTPEARQRASPRAVGQYGETAVWAEAGLGEGAPVSLTLRRRNVPGAGWRTLDVVAALRSPPNLRNADNQPLLGPGGPQEMYEKDGFDSPWGSWYEGEVLPEFAKILDDPLYALSQTTRHHVERNEGWRKRIALLEAKYPGPFAAAVRADFEAVMDRLLGEPIPLSPNDLAYRREEARQVEQVRQLAAQGWDAFQASVAATTVPAFPAPDPSCQDRAAVVGRHVVLGPLRNRDWISDSGRLWFVAGDEGSGFWFADAESPEAQAVLQALARYRRLVAPDIGETYQFVAEVLDTPRLGVVAGRAHFGLVVRVLAALVGDSLFVDVSSPGDGPVAFAGEELFAAPQSALPPPEASPADVITALVTAVKEGELALWKSLFGSWRVEYLADGRPLLHRNAGVVGENRFEEARRLILGQVLDARPIWTGDPRVVVDGSAFPGALRIEEVDVQVQHIGLFDGEYRAFSDVTLTDFWKLQRVNGGPWRVADMATL